MELVGAWSRRIAERLTPHEIDFAAEVGSAYAEGGERRRRLFTTGDGGETGGFGPGAEIGELPAILDALRAAADHLHTFLADGLIGNTLAVYALIQARRSGTTPSLERTATTGGPSAPAELNPGQGRLLDQAIAVLTERLIAYGLSRERAEQQTYRLLETIFEPGNTPEEIQALLAALLATDPAQPLPEPRLGGRPRSWMLPPWLWFYLIAYLLVGVPWLIGDWTRQATDYWTLITNSPVGVARTAGIVLGVASIAQLFPVLILLGAVASLLLPEYRGKRVERRHGLRASDNPVIEEIAAFVRRQDPSIEIRFSESTRMPARVYPVGWNKARIAVFLPLTVLWRADREAAEAVLLHEIAHRRQLDHHVVGLASPFTWLVRAWGPVFVLVGLLPITLYVVLGGAAGRLMTGQLLVHTAVVARMLLLPVMALWLAELSADRLAVRQRGPDALIRALALERTIPSGRLRRAGRVLTHPPAALRRKAAGGRLCGLTGLAVAWPATLVVRLALVSALALPAFMLTGEDIGTAIAHVLRSIVDGLAFDRLLVGGSAVLLVVWPWVVRTRHAGDRNSQLAPYALAAVLPLALYMTSFI
ncbi:M48 family metalloprotease [Microbispora bryophytorum]|uniref:M48 family metalloprotease n=1 Tax=Microbispora bryophytorum subsp. camponoti TaxID=1677852 RepID=A0ABR8L889_9ACTN|nr:M48 family metalloprotease [Microbispora camponoti]MBD3147140.1 M48 family metalloprotease [Microbispora camponoti]